jgi:hypothetical protein
MPKVHKLAGSPFLGHPTGHPRPVRDTAQSPPFPPRHKPKRKAKKIEDPPAISAGVVAFFDGAFEGGRAAFGAVVYCEGERIHEAAESVPARATVKLQCG